MHMCTDGLKVIGLHFSGMMTRSRKKPGINQQRDDVGTGLQELEMRKIQYYRYIQSWFEE